MTNHRDGNAASDANAVKRALLAVKTLQARLDAALRVEPIAVVGIGCRFPRADGPAAFWELLRAGIDAVTEIPPDRWHADSYYDPDPDAPGKMSSRWGAFLDNVDEFDAHFFGIAPREAAAMDPQQRLLLEVAWEALEHAGQSPTDLAGTRTGAFVGISTHDYGQLEMRRGDPSAIDAFFGTGNAFSVAAGRLSYVLGLRGPSVAIDTACSSSLVAVHLACQSLLAKESHLALAGGVNLIVAPETSIAVSKYHALAPDGRCKTFDARANGFVRGEGCGLVVLKRWSDAVAHGDHVYGLIKGSAVNHDGRSAGLTAPSEIAQIEVIRTALEQAGVEADAISYVEAHGTGTSLGDPIEVAALAEVFRSAPEGWRCSLGSVKTNIGHLEAAAGVAGLIKVLLSLQHGTIPPHLHLQQLNPRLSGAAAPFRIPNAPQPWSHGDRPRVAAVSSFGLSGTNAHAIVEQAPPPAKTRSAVDRGAYLLALSARSEAALGAMVQRYRQHLHRHPDIDLGDLAYTAAVGRARFPFRLAVVARSADELLAKLSAIGDRRDGWMPVPARAARPRVAFLFTGQGSQYVDMGRGLYEREPIFRRTRDEVRALAEAQLAGPVPVDDQFAAIELFALQCALVKLWRSWGIEPSIVLGHSVGEYAAAWAAGVWSLEDAAKVVVQRTRLLASIAERGGMISVRAAIDDVERVLARHPAVAVAAMNEANSVVLSGALEPLMAIAREFEDHEGIRTRALEVSQAFHSPLVDPVLDPLEAIVGETTMAPPKVRYLSPVTGGAVSAEIAEPRYWRRHARQPVRFADALAALASEPVEACLEIGPTPVLLALADRRPGRVHAASLKRGRDDEAQILSAAGELFAHGIDIDFAAFDRERGRRLIPLPTYPFERERLWLDGLLRPRVELVPPRDHAHPLLGRRVRAAVQDVIFETSISTATLAFLADHRVHDRIVIPAALHVALVLAAYSDIHARETPCRIEQMVFEEALALEDDAAVSLQVVLTPIAETGYQFRVATSAPTGWRQHASGRVSGHPRDDVAAVGHVTDVLDAQGAEDYYARLARAGIDLRARFRGIERLWAEDGRATGAIRIPTGVEPREVATLHPVVIDSTLQLLGAAVAGANGDGETWLPMGIDRVDFVRTATGALHGQASMQALAAAASDTQLGEASLFDEQGGCIFKASGVLVRRAPRELFFAADSPRRLLSHIVWRRSPAFPPASRPGRWLLLADDGGVAAALAQRLTSRGHECLSVDRRELESAGTLRFPASSPGEPPLHGIVDLLGLDAVVAEEMSADDLLEAERLASGSMLLLAKSFIDRSPAVPLFLVTRAATGAGPSAAGLAQSGMWALRRVLAREAPNLTTKIIDLDPAGPLDLDALMAELSVADGEAEIALRAGSRLTPRLVPLVAPQRSGTPLAYDGTALVTGGFGALGLELARVLVKRGTRSLVLVGRSAPDPRAAALIDALRGLDATVAVVRADVAREADVRRVLADVPPAAPLRAIFHCAGLVDDGVLPNQDWDRFVRVLAPKVAGAWHLHRATRDLPLDAFVLFSSIASSIGSPGQASYACANSFLDLLAHYRKSQNLPALSVNWGPWAAGMAAASPLARARGVTAMPPEHALGALEQLLPCGAPQATIANVDWQELAGSTAPPIFAEVAARRAPAAKMTSTLAERLRALRPAARPEMLAAHVRAEVARVLGVEELSERMEALSFSEMGMSSLMVMELRNNLQDALRCTVPATAMFNTPTVQSLTNFIGCDVLGMFDEATRPSQSAEQLAAAERIAALSEREVEDLVMRTIEELE